MTAVWTCPFCPLACDHLGVRVAAGAMSLEGGDCARAQRALGSLRSDGSASRATLDGAACTLDQAVTAAAALLAASVQPLFAGMATDVAGARALYPLACATGAICDGDAAAMPMLRALQDRGLFTATLAEVRTRADVIVFVGGVPLAQAPLIGARCGIGEQGLARRVVVLGASADADEQDALAAWSAAGVEVQALPLHDGDLFTTLALLSAPRPPAPWAALAEQLRAARYAVLIGSAARLPAQGALIVEAVNRIVGRLNQSTRAAALWVGSATAQHTFAWLSGLPLRTQCDTALQHEPHLFDTRRLLAERAVDALLWVSSFEAVAPPQADLPQIVLGPPALAAACRRQGTVFIAVATPGIHHAGHVLRTDGTVMMPLHAAHGVRDEGLPSVADVAQQLLAKVHGT
jgi:formylmethanofuran dehydrogenase subunit B